MRRDRHEQCMDRLETFAGLQIPNTSHFHYSLNLSTVQSVQVLFDLVDPS